MYDIITIGDTTLDTFLQLDPSEVRVMCTLDKEQCELCLNYADKIPVQEIHDSIAGNAANVAVAASRLELRSAIWTIMADDDVGKRAFEKFKMEKVDTKFFESIKGARSNASTVISIEGERTILVYHEPKIYRLPKLEKSHFVYLTSMSQGSEIIFDDLMDYLQLNGTKLVYQPGTFQLRLGAARAKKLLQETDIIFLNKEEAIQYSSFRNHEIKPLLEAMHNLGPKIVVVTNGPEGSYVGTGEEFWYLDIIKEVPRIEATGAGDAYASGFTAAIGHGKSVPDAMRWGAFNANGVIQKIGPQAGILTLQEIHEWERKYPDYKAKKL